LCRPVVVVSWRFCSPVVVVCRRFYSSVIVVTCCDVGVPVETKSPNCFLIAFSSSISVNGLPLGRLSWFFLDSESDCGENHYRNLTLLSDLENTFDDLERLFPKAYAGIGRLWLGAVFYVLTFEPNSRRAN
jgi:hypothetical protein